MVLVIHVRERDRPSNTGLLAAQCLPNSEVIWRGDPNLPQPALSPSADRQSLLLFPHEGAIPLDRWRGDGRPVTLVVPDGNWAQSSKVRRRVGGLAELPCVTFSGGPPSRYRLRTASSADRLCTFEAIARALDLLEPTSPRERLERLFEIVVGRLLWARGKLSAAEVVGGIPSTSRS